MTQAPAVGAEDRRMTDDEIIESIGGYEYGWHDSDDYSKDVPTGINEEIVRFISDVKGEPQWMRERRLKALELFERKPMPAWGPDLSHVDFDAFKYYVRPTDRQVNDCSVLAFLPETTTLPVPVNTQLRFKSLSSPVCLVRSMLILPLDASTVLSPIPLEF